MRIQSLSLALCALLLSTTLALPAFAAGSPVTPAVPAELGERVSRIDLDAGEKSVALAVDEIGKQHEGLLGFALHPEFGMGKDHDFVYVAYAYDSGTSGAVEDRRSRIVQYQWDAESAKLGDPVDLLSGIPAGEDRNYATSLPNCEEQAFAPQ